MSSSSHNWSAERTVNATASGIILATVALAPLPFGLARPSVWPLLSVTVGWLVLIYSVGRYLSTASNELPVRKLVVEFSLVISLAAFSIIQTLPIAGLMPGWLLTSGKVILPEQNSISLTPGETILGVFVWVSTTLLGLLSALVSASASARRWLLAGVVWIVAAHALYGILALIQFGDTLLGGPKWAYQGSATGTFVNRNTFATFLAIGLVCATAYAADAVMKDRRDGRTRFVAVLMAAPSVGAMALCAVALFLTQSRMGAVAGLAGEAAIVVFLVIKAKQPIARLAGLTVAGGGIVGLITWAYGTGTLERLGSVERDVDVRTSLYRQVWDLIMLRPWLGYGGGSFEHAYPIVHAPPVSFDLVWDRAHSVYLGLWSDFGLLFGSIPIALVAGIAARMLLHYLKHNTVSPNTIAAMASVVVVAIHSVVDFSLEMPAVACLFAVVLGAGLGSTLRRRREITGSGLERVER